jgi:hypothetical protein
MLNSHWHDPVYLFLIWATQKSARVVEKGTSVFWWGRPARTTSFGLQGSLRAGTAFPNQPRGAEKKSQANHSDLIDCRCDCNAASALPHLRTAPFPTFLFKPSPIF